MRVLFFFVHPAKYHLFKNTFPLLERSGHQYDVTIVSKDVLVDLLNAGNIPFTNLFPKGRKIKGLPTMANAAINLIRTLWKLNRYINGKKYDVFITDDVLSFLGRWKQIPTIVFTDNDIITIPKVKLIFKYADKIIAPVSTDLGEFSYKKVPFRGPKALSHLHPKYFTQDHNVMVKYSFTDKEKCIIRLAKLNATHDIHGNPGINDKDLEDVITQLIDKFEIILISERPVPQKFKRYQVNIEAIDFAQILSYSHFFIGDSATMAAEAAVLGVPNILINNIAKYCGVLVELRDKYNLQEFFGTYSEGRSRFLEMIHDNSLIKVYKARAMKLIEQSDDFNQILFQLIQSFSK